MIARGGGERWHFNGERHRDGGPAVTRHDGAWHWFRHGFHRGVAVEPGTTTPITREQLPAQRVLASRVVADLCDAGVSAASLSAVPLGLVPRRRSSLAASASAQASAQASAPERVAAPARSAGMER